MPTQSSQQPVELFPPPTSQLGRTDSLGLSRDPAGARGLALDSNGLLPPTVVRWQPRTADPVSPYEGQKWLRTDLTELRWVMNGTTYSINMPSTTGPRPAGHQASHQTAGSDALTGNVDAVARHDNRKNSAGSVFSRRRTNYIEGVGITLTVADDAANEEVDVTIASNVTTRQTNMVFVGSDVLPTYSFSATVNQTRLWQTLMPWDWNGGNFSLKYMWRVDISGGTCVLRRHTYRLRDAATFTQFDNNVNWNQSPANLQSHLVTVTTSLTGANFNLGDVFQVTLIRLGADAGDTNTGELAIDGVWIEYTAA